ncbi:replication restart helicase PriA [Acetanaerobacterium elongatum]|uniref:Replication restart protein PriA n=1 Tax=Acetanaerobacterium elongatum TaxID=258515 RepID=A0A1G9VPL0_9FIRM|nr:primosomal protein N' [Acetanaerobacterium elongatum]SDM73745.1 replication restart DNA helicase PriA [Acetanaerobacterium elongatum]
MSKQSIAYVAVDKVALHFDKEYSYIVPPALREAIHVGTRVAVPFGGGNRKRQGLVLSLVESEPQGELKPVAELIDQTPILSGEMLSLVMYLKQHTLCTYYEAVHLVLPAGLNMAFSVTYAISSGCDINSLQLSGERLEIVSCLLKQKKPMSEKKLFAAAGINERSAALKGLVAEGVIIKQQEAARRTKDERVLMVRLSPAAEGEFGRLSEKQSRVVELLEQFGSASVKEVFYYTEAAKSTLDVMCKRGITEYFEREVLRTPYAAQAAENAPPPDLSEAQQAVYEGLRQLCTGDHPEAALLFGITGSGKTHIFLKLIADELEKGRQAIMLVPEIALTPQMLQRFHAVFGSKVAVLHSGLSLGERLDEYKRIRSGEACIAVGTRSAVFAPFENLGLIIIDEEQEHTYKSESAPRYHAREVAKFRCAQHRALLLMASATPSIETFYHAKTGRYKLFELTERFGEAVLPQVVVVNMGDEAAAGNTGAISSPLAQEIEQNLIKGEQTILFINRRGYHTLVTCAECGEVLTCPNCSIALTYHRANDRMMCHYCGYVHTPEHKCSHCGSEHIKQLGLGTQKVEDQLAELFPEARVLRMDADTTLAKYSYDEYLSRFARGEYDILVGTQMVAKGLDFENVSLVGVLSADRFLYTTDFRGLERSFSLLTQVVGRSGRGTKRGRAYIQTYTPEHEIIELSARQDYREFYEGELLCRKNLLYPPFCSFCVIGFSGENEGQTLLAANELLKLLQGLVKNEYEDVPLKVFGPCPSSVLKVANKYRYRLIIKCRDDRRTRMLLQQLLCEYGRLPYAKTVSAFIDLNYDGPV